MDVHLPLPSDDAIGKAFVLEEAIERRVESTGVGVVDGNEVGRGDFVIYVFGSDLLQLRDQVAGVIREQWTHPGATLRLLGTDGDEKTVAL